MQTEIGAGGHSQTALVPTWPATGAESESSPQTGRGHYDAAALRSGLWWEGTRDGAVLLLHDFGVTPEGLAGPALAMYYEGFWTAAPLLAGHDLIDSTGRLGAFELADVLSTVDRWVAALQAATMPLVVAGFGLGASLAVLVATTYRVHGLVTVNLPVRSYHRRRFRSRLASLVTGRASGLDLDVKRDDVTEAQAGFMDADAFRIARDLERLGAAELPSVRVPTLMFQSRDDHVVAASDATAALDALGTSSRELVWLERSFHSAWLDHDAPLMAERSAAFVRALCDRPALPAPPAAAMAGADAATTTGIAGPLGAPDGFGTGEWPAIAEPGPQQQTWGWGGEGSERPQAG
ncbi:MAG: hypothetical protein U0U69_10660 [Acidimicrobiia bacterium]